MASPICVFVPLSTSTQPSQAQPYLCFQHGTEARSDPYLNYILPTANLLMWPVLIVFLLILFRQTIHLLLTGVNNLSVKLFGYELTFSRMEAKDALQAVVDELFKGLDEAQRALSHRVRDARGTADVARIFDGFERHTPEHNLLRSLRDRLVIGQFVATVGKVIICQR